jgi:hypothetical protein
MTTAAAEAQYLQNHLWQYGGRQLAVYNPHDKAVEDLPVIYGFNNGGSSGWLDAQLVTQDGEFVGGHCCSAEGYMPHDLGVIEGSRPDRHETFRLKYPDGYRMDFASYGDVPEHAGIQAAFKAAEARAALTTGEKP